jgi:cobalt-zinc-cadmium resistance protein CzcA|tara:strand:+ start:34437 stop:37580 length:3144 start_codon:yes stop_codon:yes gene_type:complete
VIDKIIETSVRSKGLVAILSLAVVIAGWLSFQSLPIDAVPDITNVQVQINTSVEGLVPEEIEKFVTFPVESGMGGMPGVEQIRSISRFGLSQVTIIFEEGTDIYLARQLVAEKLQALSGELPEGTQPQMGPITTGLGEIYFYSIEAKEPATGEARAEQLMELRALNEWFITPRLLMVKGVAEVNAIGGYEKQFFVEPNLKKLSSYGIHLDDVVSAIENNNRNTGGGYIQQTAEQLLIQASGLVRNKKDIENIVVKSLPSLRNIKIGDIAKVKLGRELRTGAALVNGKETVVGTILMLLGENSRTVSISVDEKIQEIKKTLPDWVVLNTVYNRSELVDATLGTVQGNLIFGALLVVLTLLLLVGNLRVALITAITIPLSMLSTFILMKYFNVSGNLMSLGALDFGIIIDGAVIVMDNCIRWVAQKKSELGRSLTREEVKEFVVSATKEIRSAAGFGQLIVVIVFVPLFTLTGVEGKMFIPMASAFCFALGAAFIFSFSIIPCLAGLFISRDLEAKTPWLMRKLDALYPPILEKALLMKKTVVVGGVATGALGVVLFSTLGSNFLPQLDEGSIAIQFVRPTNISIDQSVEMQKLSEEVILEFAEVDRVVSRIGTAEIATDPMGPNISDTYVLLKDDSEWPKVDGSKRNKAKLIDALKERIEAFVPGQSLIFSQPIQLRFNELLEGVRADVSVKVFGEDMEVITEIASEIATLLQNVEGVGESEEEVKGLSPVLRITPKAEAISNLGIPKENILTTVETAIGGKEAGSLFQGVMRFPIVVRLGDEDRSNIDAIKNIPVGITDSYTEPLSEVADVKIQETYGDIRREQSKKRAAVLINVRGRDTESLVSEAQKLVSENVKVPSGYYIEWGGSFENLKEARKRLMVVVPIALMLVLFMIYMAFQSVLQTAMIAACIPMALVGGVISLMLNGLSFSISAGVGFIALSGLAVLNGIVLVSYFNKLKLSGLSGDELIREGTKMRLRPVVMTATSTVFGFIPMMVSTGMGAEVQRPLASVVVGGIISATILTLIVLPIVYRLLEDKMVVKESSISH